MGEKEIRINEVKSDRSIELSQEEKEEKQNIQLSERAKKEIEKIKNELKELQESGADKMAILRKKIELLEIIKRKFEAEKNTQELREADREIRRGVIFKKSSRDSTYFSRNQQTKIY